MPSGEGKRPNYVLEGAPRELCGAWALTIGRPSPSSLLLFHSFTLTLFHSPTLFKSPPHTRNCYPDRSGPAFSSAPHFGSSGRAMEGSLRQLSLLLPLKRTAASSALGLPQTSASRPVSRAMFNRPWPCDNGHNTLFYLAGSPSLPGLIHAFYNTHTM